MQRDPAALKAALADLEHRHLRRTRRVGIRGGLVNFSSNDYLGLAAHPDVVRAFRDAAANYGVGSGARIWSPVTGRNTTPSKKRSPHSRAARKRWSIRPATWPIWVSLVH
jgi:7-keto-8-aminopelargonate synthetase-like enzyme